MRHDQQQGTGSTTTKSCAVCGRLISPHVRNFQERKYCSKTCSTTRLTTLDQEMEDEFVELAVKRGFVDCGEVQQIIGERCGRHKGAVLDDLSQEEKTRAGNDEAVFRERVRRAARRVVVNGRDGKLFVCWSKGRVEEPSFAKGEWSVKYIKQ